MKVFNIYLVDCFLLEINIEFETKFAAFNVLPFKVNTAKIVYNNFFANYLLSQLFFFIEKISILKCTF